MHWFPRVGWFDVDPQDAVSVFDVSAHYQWEVWGFAWLGWGIHFILRSKKPA